MTIADLQAELAKLVDAGCDPQTTPVYVHIQMVTVPSVFVESPTIVGIATDDGPRVQIGGLASPR